MKTKTQPESVILRAVRRFLGVGGWYVVRHQAGLGTHPGLADLQAIRDGRVVMIEVKTASGRLSEAQERFRHDWQRSGGTYLVARGVDDVAHLTDCLPLAGERTDSEDERSAPWASRSTAS